MNFLLAPVMSHIIANLMDLRPIKNNKICKLSCNVRLFGRKYRKPTSINFHNAKKSILSGTDECIERFSRKKST